MSTPPTPPHPQTHIAILIIDANLQPNAWNNKRCDWWNWNIDARVGGKLCPIINYTFHKRCDRRQDLHLGWPVDSATCNNYISNWY